MDGPSPRNKKIHELRHRRQATDRRRDAKSWLLCRIPTLSLLPASRLPARMPQHVRMQWERHLGGLAEPLDEMVEGRKPGSDFHGGACVRHGFHPPGSDGRMACRSWPCGRACGPGLARPDAIGDRTPPRLAVHDDRRPGSFMSGGISDLRTAQPGMQRAWAAGGRTGASASLALPSISLALPVLTKTKSPPSPSTASI